MRTPAGERTAWRELKETLGGTPKFSLDFGLVFTGVTWVSSGRISLGSVAFTFGHVHAKDLWLAEKLLEEDTDRHVGGAFPAA